LPANPISVIATSGRRFLSRATGGEEQLWRVWWLAGIPVAWLTTGLVLLAESLRSTGFDGWGDALDVARLLLYFAWFRLAWRCSRNVERRAWTRLAQGALAAGLVLSVMF
jgi:hypothetical protein